MKKNKFFKKLLSVVSVLLVLCTMISANSIPAYAISTEEYYLNLIEYYDQQYLSTGKYIESGDFYYSFIDDEKTVVKLEKYIRDGAETVTFPATIDGYPVKEIGVDIFDNCRFKEILNIKHIIIEDGIELIEAYPEEQSSSLSYASNIESVYLSNTLKEIGFGSFSGCTKLKGVKIPSSVEYIEDDAFFGCSSITNVSIGKNVKHIDEYAFSNCQSLKSIKVDSENKNYLSKGGVLFTKDKSTLVAYPAGKTSEEYTVPSSVNRIDKGAFCGAKNLKEVTIPSSVKEILRNTFSSCEKLEKVNLPKELEKIEFHAFSNTALKSLEIPKSVKKFYSECVSGCYTIKKLTIKNPKCILYSFSYDIDKGEFKNTTIYGYENSNAQQWAYDQGLKFKKIGSYTKVIKLANKDYHRNSLTLSWKKVAGADKYTVYMSTNKNKGFKKVKSTKSNKLAVKKLKTGETYYFKVRASKGKKTYEFSEVFETTTKPETPIIDNITSKNGSATISWTEDKNTDICYIYMSETKDGKYEKVGRIYSYKESFTMDNLKKGKTYYFKIKTANRIYNDNAEKYKYYFSNDSSVKSVKIK